jgi:hypothetical protein
MRDTGDGGMPLRIAGDRTVTQMDIGFLARAIGSSAKLASSAHRGRVRRPRS